jgi:diguanylate cyclase (GGDEF)-like protein
MESQVYYILISMVFTSAALSVIFFLAWRHLGEKPYALSWTLAYCAGTLQWFLDLNSGWFDNRQLYSLIGNGLALVLITLIVKGHCQRTQCRLLPQNLWPFAFAVFLALVWSTLIDPHKGVRGAIIPVTVCLSLFLCALMIIRHREHSRPAEWATAVSMVLFGVSQGIAAGMSFLQGATGDAAYSALYDNYYFITLPAGYVTTSMFVIFMLASDLSADMKSIAIRDQLTGLFNRRGFTEHGENAYSLARRSGTPLSIIMADIDRFKYINDKFGHAAGDAALRHFAKLISEDRRQEDIVARVGGEEFAIILPGTELRDAMAIADQLCTTVGARPMDLTSVGLPMTSSFGVASISKDDRELDDMVRRADRALYRSKRAGRNQVDLESSQLMLAADGTLRPVQSA